MSIVEAPAQLQAWIDELGDQIAVLSTRRYKLIEARDALNTPPATTAPAPRPDLVATLESGVLKASAAERRGVAKAPPAKRGRRRGLPPLEEVARVYNKARANDRPTTQALIEEFGSRESTVRNWVAAARKAGLLDATVTEITKAPGAQPKGPASQGGRQPSVNYVEIAQVMTELRDAGASVQDGIAKRYAVPPSTAKNWMARCREQGLIKPLAAGLRVVEDNTIDPEQSAAAVYDGRAVAEQYLAAIRQNMRPIQAVADRFEIDKQLAAQWVRRARADGELPPAAEPQLPEQERRAMLDASKPETL